MREGDALRLLPLAGDEVPGFLAALEAEIDAALDPALAHVGLTLQEFFERATTLGERRTVWLGDERAGYAWLEIRGRTLHVHALLLAPAFRGAGVGGRTLAALEQEFAGAVDELELGVHDANRAARALYDRCGFHEVERLADIGFTIMRKPIAIRGNP